MKRLILRFLIIYFLWFLLFCLEKPIFLLLYQHLSTEASIGEVWDVIYHGLSIDASVAGYFTALPALLLFTEAIIGHRTQITDIIGRVYFFIASTLASFCFILNLVLYEYWRFPLDSTPIFYFTSSPKDAFASAPWWQTLLGFGLVILLSWSIYLVFSSLIYPSHKVSRRPYSRRIVITSKERLINSIIMLLFSAALFLPIRGGLSVSTMNTGHAYYSSCAILNHAAINPFFSLMESIVKAGKFKEQYRFMPEKRAEQIFNSMYDKSFSSDSIIYTDHPNLLIIVMESFSSKIMHETGGLDNVAVHLDSIARNGILFTNFYGNSFRTDRGLLSILSGYPAQPTMSLMKYPKKTSKLPSICSTLIKEGYTPHYFYGGDADFTNMRSYLTQQGFTNIISEPDFKSDIKRGKWGIQDGPLFEKALTSLHERPKEPFFTVIQTSSSHEPFEVPYNKLKNKRLNAFAYTDSIIGNFLRNFSQLPSWQHTLVVLVPDHLGAYPEDIDPLTFDRFRIPLILTGGVVKKSKRISTIGSQQDIAATLLAALGCDRKPFRFSKNLLSKKSPHFAFFTIPDALGIINDKGGIIYDNAAQRIADKEGDADTLLLHKGQAYLQTLYNDIDNR